MKIRHPFMDKIICKRKRKFKLSTTYRSYPKHTYRVTQRKKSYKHKSQQNK